jgi:KEOPS complex subunit Pcc1
VTHVAEFSLHYATIATAERVAMAMEPEVGDIEGDRTRATLERDGSTLRIVIEADDLVALRAGLNTWLSLADVAERSGASTTA